MIKKGIGQNSDRYSKMGAQWKISASPNVEPLYLPIGVNPTDLLPVLEVDGVIVEVGGYKLISQATLNNINQSNNPHYDLNQNGTIKGVSIGKTIPTLKINLDSLTQSANERDIINRNAGVSSVQYIFQGDMVGDTNLSVNLVKQINYTLNPDIDRPKDTYYLTELQLAPADTYDIRTENALDKQDLENSIFSYSKLEEYLNSVKDAQINLQKDFFLLKGVFYDGNLPTGLTNYKVTKMATAEDIPEPDDVQIIYKQAKPIIAVVASPPPNSNVGVSQTTPSNVQVWALSGKNYTGLGVFEKDPTTGDKGKRLQLLPPGGRFIGTFYKNWNNSKVYKVYENGGVKVIGYLQDGSGRVVSGE